MKSYGIRQINIQYLIFIYFIKKLLKFQKFNDLIIDNDSLNLFPNLIHKFSINN